MKTHELKTDTEPFQAVHEGKKTFEIRLNDRDFHEGDELVLKETQHTGLEMKNGEPLIYTGREETRIVSHVLRGPIYGLQNGWCILSFDCQPDEMPFMPPIMPPRGGEQFHCGPC